MEDEFLDKELESEFDEEFDRFVKIDKETKKKVNGKPAQAKKLDADVGAVKKDSENDRPAKN